MKAPDFLQQAKETMEERGKSYDKDGDQEERSMAKAIAMFNLATGRDLTDSEGWMLMVLLKIVRQWSAEPYHHDSALDSVAYTALMAEALNEAHKKAYDDAFDIPVGSSEIRDSHDLRVENEPLYNGLGDNK